MKNKILIELVIPDLDKVYNVFIPVNKKVGNIIVLLTKAINELTNEDFPITQQVNLYNSFTGETYPMNELIRKTTIRNGCRLVLM